MFSGSLCFFGHRKLLSYVLLPDVLMYPVGNVVVICFATGFRNAVAHWWSDRTRGVTCFFVRSVCFADATCAPLCFAERGSLSYVWNLAGCSCSNDCCFSRLWSCCGWVAVATRFCRSGGSHSCGCLLSGGWGAVGSAVLRLFLSCPLCPLFLLRVTVACRSVQTGIRCCVRRVVRPDVWLPVLCVRL